MKYVALLRGINVGGKNIIKMINLKECFESLGLTEMMTYIQSGNVVFSSTELDMSNLSTLIENKLSERFQYESKIVLIAENHYNRIVTNAPLDYGTNDKVYRYNVLFLRPTLLVEEAMPMISKREGVDEVYAGEGVVYCSNLIARTSQSHLSRLIKQPIYPEITIRNWNTTVKLFKLLS